MSDSSLPAPTRLPLQQPFCVPARFSIPMVSGAIQCITCRHKCVIPPDAYGHCGTRKNVGGVLYAGTYGLVSSMAVNPMEKKPFFHYWPGEQSLTVGSFGCNFDCFWCQNHDISHTYPRETHFPEYLSPDQLVSITVKKGLRSISFSFNEPTLNVEYALDVLQLMRSRGLKGNFVTNGFMSSQVRDALGAGGLDAACINIKGDDRVVQQHCRANVEHVWDNVKSFAQAGIHVELVTLVIPGIKDAREAIDAIASRIYHDISPDTPWHLTRFHPDWQAPERGFTKPTPIPTLEQCRQRGLDTGLHFVYIGNVAGHPGENTYCPACGKIVIKRIGYDIRLHYAVEEDKVTCQHCGQEIPIRLKPKSQ